VPLTEDETRVFATAWGVHLAERERREEKPDAELWFAVEDIYVPEAHRLCERGRLHRRVGHPAMEWRLTDEQAVAFELHGLTSVEGRDN
jgi:hypothetical protein